MSEGSSKHRNRGVRSFNGNAAHTLVVGTRHLSRDCLVDVIGTGHGPPQQPVPTSDKAPAVGRWNPLLFDDDVRHFATAALEDAYPLEIDQ
ncbi:hypothetical protein C3477_04885 [Mycobacterium kansasii]|nr:hypothetical protein C3B43_07980 [Mycobacterium kansasii]POY08204.1 hypothetical protein C3477_04885 [Mycobacterium kansasii]POY24017.1 hypothetical protein C3476_05980 [Mycobacterium kansasii]